MRGNGIALVVAVLAVVGGTPALVRADGNEAPGAPAVFRHLSAGGSHTCAILFDGSVRCWGLNDKGQLGLGDNVSRGGGPGEMGGNLPAVDLGTGRTAVAISAATNHTCAVLDNASVKCWGNNQSGELGLGDVAHRGDGAGEMGDNLPAVDLGTGRTAVAISAAQSFSCALLDNASVKCWGSNFSGKLGQGDNANRGDALGEMGDALLAVELGTGRTAVAVVAGGFHACALLDNAWVKCWGAGGAGALGNESNTNRGDGSGEMGDNLLEVNLGNGRTATAITAGTDHTCALLDNGSVKCWGQSNLGQLGLGVNSQRGSQVGSMGDNLAAVELGTGRTAVAVRSKFNHTCAVLDDASVKCWGWNVSGQLGLGDTDNRGEAAGEMGDALPAVALGTGRTVVAVSTGVSHTCARLDDGSLKCWGINDKGQLGLGDTATRGAGPNEMGDNLPLTLKGEQTISFTSTAPAAAKVGGATYAVTATATSGLAVAFIIDPAATTICSIAGATVSFLGVGTCVINADQGGNATFNAAPQVQQSFAVAQGDQTISFTSTAPAAAKVGGATYAVTATATSGLAVTFTIDPAATTICSIAASTVSFIGVGTCVINANQGGDANYNPAPQVQQSFAVAAGDQTISFTSTAPVAAKVGGATYDVAATATSGLAVTFTIDPAATTICSIAGATVSFIGVGTCVINANQGGNANYNPAPQVQQSFAVAQGEQTISFTSTAPVAAKVGGATYAVTGTATSGLAVAFTIDPAATTICSIAGATVSFISVGTCVINANQGGNANYNPAPQVQQSFAVAKGEQTISFTSSAPAAAAVGGTTYTVTATGGASGNPVTFGIDAIASAVCSISGSTVSFAAVGTCVINANQAGTSDYNAAPQMQQSFAVGKGAQAVSITSSAPGAAVVGGTTYTVTATGGASGNPVTFAIDAIASAICSISGSTVSFLAVGTCVINANQAGSSNYNAAPQAQQSFAVAKGAQAIGFTSSAPAAAVVGGTTYNVSATGGASGNAVTFSIDAIASAVCSISGSTVSFLTVGTCVIDANQAGSSNYNPAPQVQQSFAVGKGEQTISFTSTAPAAAKVGVATYAVTATATSGLAVTFTIDPAATTICSIAGSTVSFIGVGTCVINANQGGNANYNAAPQVQQSFAVAQGGTLNVSRSGGGSGTVTSTDLAINCGADCAETYAPGSAVTLNATPAAGSIFTGWLGACTGVGSCPITIAAGASSVVATFAPDTVLLRLDVDANNHYDPLTDGLLLIRYMFGLRGNSLTDNALGTGAANNTPESVAALIENIKPLLDIDGNGQLEALSDGILVMRYLFGMRGSSLVAAAIGAGATRSSAAQVAAHLGSLTP